MQIPQGYILIKKEEYQHFLDTIEYLQRRNNQLEARVRILEKNSTNSSIPPSKDENKKIKNQSLRKRSGKKPGGQKGHKGITRLQVSQPDIIELCVPNQCQRCGCDLTTLDGEIIEKRQEIDIPPIKPIVTEYQRMSIMCSCGHYNIGKFPDKIKAPVQLGRNIMGFLIYLNVVQLIPFKRLQQLCEDIFNFSLCKRTIENILNKGYEKAKPLHNKIMQIIKNCVWVGTAAIPQHQFEFCLQSNILQNGIIPPA